MAEEKQTPRAFDPIVQDRTFIKPPWFERFLACLERSCLVVLEGPAKSSHGRAPKQHCCFVLTLASVA